MSLVSLQQIDFVLTVALFWLAQIPNQITEHKPTL